MSDVLRAPFPWFGGKRRVAAQVWQAFGDVPNYCEPFAGSLAVLLARPTPARIETVNDLDCNIANVWRAIQAAPDEVAHWADWPVNEADLHARHLWLVYGTPLDDVAVFRERMKTEPDFFDPKRAGWWVWGISQWIGGGWCTPPKEGAAGTYGGRKKPLIGGTKGTGVHKRSTWRRSFSRHDPDAVAISVRAPVGIHKRGVATPTRQLPCISGDSGASGRGIHASGATWTVYEWMKALSERLRRVRVCCGDWRRVLGPSPTTCIGVTAVLLDPPYSAASGRTADLYAEDNFEISHDVREWAVANGDNPKLRIALCGYEDEHEMPERWQCVPWEAAGGYGSKANAKRERIWFSPHCLTVRQQLTMFAEARS